LFFLGADPSADCGEQVRFLDDADRRFEISLLNFFNKTGNGNADRTALYAGLVFTGEAAFRLESGLGFTVTQGDLVHVFPARYRILGRHFLSGNCHALPGGYPFTRGFALQQGVQYSLGLGIIFSFTFIAHFCSPLY